MTDQAITGVKTEGQAAPELLLDPTRLNEALSGARQWIGAADQKATALLTLGAAVVAFPATFITNALTPAQASIQVNWWFAIPFLAFLVCGLAGLGFSAWALLPRFNRFQLLIGHGWEMPGDFSLFFGDLFKADRATLEVLLQTPKTGLVCGGLSRAETLEQIYILVRIANHKMTWVWRSTIALTLSTICLAISCGAPLIVAWRG